MLSASLNKTFFSLSLLVNTLNDVCVDYFQNKTCVQTLEGHAQNVSAVSFHPELPIILTGSEDGRTFLKTSIVDTLLTAVAFSVLLHLQGKNILDVNGSRTIIHMGVI